MTEPQSENAPIELEAEAAEAGLRLDVFLAGRLEDVSRNVVQSAIKAGRVSVNGHEALRPSRGNTRPAGPPGCARRRTRIHTMGKRKQRRRARRSTRPPFEVPQRADQAAL